MNFTVEIEPLLPLEKMDAPWKPLWEESLSTFPEAGLWFLSEAFIREANQTVHLADTAISAILDTAKAIKENPLLSRIAWHIHRLLFHEKEYDGIHINGWLEAGQRIYTGYELISVVVLLSGIPQLKDDYQRRGISDEILQETLADIRGWMDDYYRRHQKWGFGQLGWMRNHFSRKLYRLGRMQYAPVKFKGEIKAFRHAGSDEIVVLSDAGVAYRRDGFINGTNGHFDEEGTWTSDIRYDLEFVEGHPVRPDGTCSKESVKLHFEEFSPCLEKNDMVLDVHIPAGVPLKRELCLDSYQQGLRFFAKYYPEIEIKGFVCTSWLLEPQLKQILPATSNIVVFQSDYCQYPFKSDDAQMFDRVFDSKPNDLSTLPSKTPLQAAIREYVLSGHQMRMGGGFILKNQFQPAPDR